MQFENANQLDSYLKNNPKLTDLLIEDSPNLVAVPMPASTQLHLKVLQIHRCANIRTFDTPKFLKYLSLKGCPTLLNLQQLPDSLVNLLIYDCPLITKIPALPTALGNMRIRRSKLA